MNALNVKLLVLANRDLSLLLLLLMFAHGKSMEWLKGNGLREVGREIVRCAMFVIFVTVGLFCW